MPELTDEQQDHLNKCLDDVLERGRILGYIVDTGEELQIVAYDNRGLVKRLYEVEGTMQIYDNRPGSSGMTSVCQISR
jgi:hypothetical protein